jgi:hypothetical protein
MKFGPVALSEAEGGVLAHSLLLGRVRLKKGHVLVRRIWNRSGRAASTR